MPKETFEGKKPTPAQHEANKAFKPLDAEKTITEQDRAQKAFRENHERLKAERLAREGNAK